MTIDTTPINTSVELPIDTTGTVALFKLPHGAIQRTQRLSFLLNPEASFDYRLDIGVLPNGVDKPDSESDLVWYNGIVEKSKSSDDPERESLESTSTYLRLYVDTAAADGSTSDVAMMVGRE